MYAELVRRFVQINTDDAAKDETKLNRFDMTLPNIIVIVSKLADFYLCFLMYPLTTVYQYYLNSVSQVTP